MLKQIINEHTTFSYDLVPKQTVKNRPTEAQHMTNDPGSLTGEAVITDSSPRVVELDFYTPAG